jgi:CubicO group peptidase (beta-lactamase class C family)
MTSTVASRVGARPVGSVDMADLTIEIDPAEVGLDADRLARIDQHFQRYTDDGRLAGWLAVVSRRGKIAHVGMAGQRDLQAGLPVQADTLWRIYSMTKPITSVAAMMLVELGAMELTDPISRYIPAFADARVYVKGSALKPLTVPVTEPIRVWHLLTHTSGLTYGFHHTHVTDAIYRAHGFEWGCPRDWTWLRPPRRGPDCRWPSSPARSGTTRSRPTYLAGWWRWSRASRWTSSSPATSCARWA